MVVYMGDTFSKEIENLPCRSISLLDVGFVAVKVGIETLRDTLGLVDNGGLSNLSVSHSAFLNAVIVALPSDPTPVDVCPSHGEIHH